MNLYQFGPTWDEVV